MATAAIQTAGDQAIRARKICVLMSLPPSFGQHAGNAAEPEIRQ
jgi:hypothetical protein